MAELMALQVMQWGAVRYLASPDYRDMSPGHKALFIASPTYTYGAAEAEAPAAPPADDASSVPFAWVAAAAACFCCIAAAAAAALMWRKRRRRPHNDDAKAGVTQLEEVDPKDLRDEESASAAPSSVWSDSSQSLLCDRGREGTDRQTSDPISRPPALHTAGPGAAAAKMTRAAPTSHQHDAPQRRAPYSRHSREGRAHTSASSATSGLPLSATFSGMPSVSHHEREEERGPGGSSRRQAARRSVELNRSHGALSRSATMSHHDTISRHHHDKQPTQRLSRTPPRRAHGHHRRHGPSSDADPLSQTLPSSFHHGSFRDFKVRRGRASVNLDEV